MSMKMLNELSNDFSADMSVEVYTYRLVSCERLIDCFRNVVPDFDDELKEKVNDLETYVFNRLCEIKKEYGSEPFNFYVDELE